MTSDQAEILALKHWGQAVDADLIDGVYEVTLIPLSSELEPDIDPHAPRGTSEVSFWEALLALHRQQPALLALPERDPYADA